ncbi:MAG: polymer-forming cytoskeletal protein [Acetobacteraceae bacterium]|nr:polymer-forming cytoskeletal protein [Acetobacteraceae bacterium]
MRTPTARLPPIANCSEPNARRSLVGDRRGSVAVMTAVMLPVLLGFVALAAEVSTWENQRLALQRTADLSALAAAKLLYAGNTAQSAATAAINLAEINGIPAATRSWSGASNTLSNSYVTVALVNGVRSASDQAFKVTVSQPVTSYLAQLFISTSGLTASASGWAELVQTTTANVQPCVVGLAKESSPGTVLGVNINGGSAFNAGGCVVRANADIQVKGGTTMTTAGLYSGGDVWVGGGTKVQGSSGAATNVYTNNDTNIGYDFGGGSDGGSTLTGNAYAAGNINVNGSSTITAIAEAGGSITLNSGDIGGSIGGAATAVGNITMNSGAIKGTTAAGGNITLNGGTVTGPISGSGTLTLNNGASINGNTSVGALTVNVGSISGNVSSTGATAIASGSTITGNVTSGSIAISNGYIVGNASSVTKATYPGWESKPISGTQSLGSAPSDPSAPSSPGSPGVIADPYATNSTVQNALSTVSSGSGGSAINVGWNANPVVLSPGTYSSISVSDYQSFSNGATVTFQPGTYYVNGPISLSGTAIVGSGVTFVTSGTVSISAASVTLSAPLANATTGIAGMLFAGSGATSFDIGGGSNVSLTGVMYFPRAAMTISGGVKAGSSGCLELIANTVTLTGGSTFGSTCTSYGAATFSAVPPVTIVALVQ